MIGKLYSTICLRKIKVLAIVMMYMRPFTLVFPTRYAKFFFGWFSNFSWVSFFNVEKNMNYNRKISKVCWSYVEGTVEKPSSYSRCSQEYFEKNATLYRTIYIVDCFLPVKMKFINMEFLLHVSENVFKIFCSAFCDLFALYSIPIWNKVKNWTIRLL